MLCAVWCWFLSIAAFPASVLALMCSACAYSSVWLWSQCCSPPVFLSFCKVFVAFMYMLCYVQPLFELVNLGLLPDYCLVRLILPVGLDYYYLSGLKCLFCGFYSVALCLPESFCSVITTGNIVLPCFYQNSCSEKYLLDKGTVSWATIRFVGITSL